MKILVLNPFGGTEFRGKQNLKKIKRPDTEFDMVNISDAYPLMNNQFLYFRYKCTDGTIDHIIEAEKQGYDAVFISCNLDIGLYEARSLVHIPVTATLESAALVACMMGAKFSIISVDEQNAKIQKMILNQYGLDDKLASYRSIDIDANDLYPEKTPEDIVYKKAIKASKLAVQEDDAEVIIPGCTLIGSVLTYRMAETCRAISVPVLDGMVTGFKLAEMMVDIRNLANIKPVSRIGYFQFPPKKDLDVLRAYYGKDSITGII